jgi:hypothetical protein
MENLHYKEIKKALIDNNIQTNMFDMSTAGVDGESINASIQIAPTTGLGDGQIWFNFPFEHEPLWLLNEAKIPVPKEFSLGEWEKEDYCVFELDFTIDIIEETVAIFLSKLLDVFYGKPNKTLQIDIENLGGDSDGSTFDHDLHDLYSDAGIKVGFDSFSNSENIIQLRDISGSELFKELALLKTKIKEIEDDTDLGDEDWKQRYSLETTNKKLPLLKEYFYKSSQLYSHNKTVLSFDDNEDNQYTAWHFESINTHLNLWKIDEYKKMVEHYRSTFNNPELYNNLDERLENLTMVIKLVKEEPGIERKNLYKKLSLNGRSYSSFITRYLVDNGILMEEQTKSKRMLYPSS